MGFLKSIASKFMSSGIGKFLTQTTFGKILLNMGLTALTAGIGGLLASGLSMLPKLASAGNMFSSFGTFASKFLAPVQSFFSQSGLSSVAGFLGNTSNSTDLLSMAGELLKARQQRPETDPSTESIATHNLSQLFAHQQAQQLLQMFAR